MILNKKYILYALFSTLLCYPSADILAQEIDCNCKEGMPASGNITDHSGWAAYEASVKKTESGGQACVVNSIGYAGYYQMGYAALVDVGCVKNDGRKGNGGGPTTYQWTGKCGNSWKDFCTSDANQLAAFKEYTNRNVKCASGAMSHLCEETCNQKTGQCAPATIWSIAKVSHLVGCGNATNVFGNQVITINGKAYGKGTSVWTNGNNPGQYAVEGSAISGCANVKGIEPTVPDSNNQLQSNQQNPGFQGNPNPDKPWCAAYQDPESLDPSSCSAGRVY